MTGGPPIARSRRAHLRSWAPEYGLAVAFLVLAVVVRIRPAPLGPDGPVLDALPPRNGPGSVRGLSAVVRIVTDAAEPTVWTIGSLVLAAGVALAARSLRLLRLAAVPVLVSAGAVLALKAAVDRPGPPGDRLSHGLGYFPSGHTATTLVCTGALAALLAVRWPGWARALRIVVAAWTVLVAAALVYYRYHWVSDTVGSLLLGWLILRLACRSLWGPAAERSGDDPAPQDDALRLREDV